MKPLANWGVYNAMHSPTCGRLPVLIALGLILALGGCASEEPAPARRDVAAAPKHKPPTPIEGREDYFDGKIGVDIQVGALDLAGAREGAGPGPNGGGEGGGRRRGGGMSGGMSMGGMGMGEGRGGGGGRHRGGPEGESGGDRPAGVRPMMGSMGPAEIIHLQFTNHGIERVEVNIVDFVSPLGNFAVQPEKLVLEPGQSLEVEPMSSRLGGSVAEVEATLVLRLAGKTEKKTIVLRAVSLPGDQPGQTPAGPQAGTVQPAPGK